MSDPALMVLAHAAHTITTIAYFVPVVGFLIWLVFITIRDRRARRRGGESPPRREPE